jgi:hypothetical protein
MIADSLRPILFAAAGLVVGFLVAWGLFERLSTKSAGASVLPAATSSTVSSPGARGRAPSQVEAGASRSSTEENVATEANPSATVSPSPSAVVQQNGLPLGVIQGALNYNKELYQKYPGLNPPQINTDGRDLGAGATQQMREPPTMLPTPSPGVSVSPFPLVFHNRPAVNLSSPLPKQ